MLRKYVTLPQSVAGSEDAPSGNFSKSFRIKGTRTRVFFGIESEALCSHVSEEVGSLESATFPAHFTPTTNQLPSVTRVYMAVNHALIRL